MHDVDDRTEREMNPKIKFGGPRRGRSVMFRLEFTDHLPILMLTEGEWDTMMIWQAERGANTFPNCGK